MPRRRLLVPFAARRAAQRKRKKNNTKRSTAAKEAAATDATAPQAGRDDASSWSSASLKWELVAVCVKDGVAFPYYMQNREPIPFWQRSRGWVRDPERDRPHFRCDRCGHIWDPQIRR